MSHVAISAVLNETVHQPFNQWPFLRVYLTGCPSVSHRTRALFYIISYSQPTVWNSCRVHFNVGQRGVEEAFAAVSQLDEDLAHVFQGHHHLLTRRWSWALIGGLDGPITVEESYSLFSALEGGWRVSGFMKKHVVVALNQRLKRYR